MKDILFNDARAKSKDCVIEAKIDGSNYEYNGNGLISHRGIDRSKDRFPHIFAELANLDFIGRGEIAIPNGNVHTLAKKVSWPHARFYLFELYEVAGKDWRQATAEDVRKKLEELFKDQRKKFKHLRIPFAWKNFEKAWDYTKDNDLEGLVLKPKGIRGGELRIKHLKEAKLKIIGFEVGSQKGAFIIESPNGEISKVSALSVDFIKDYEKMIVFDEDPYVEIEFPFWTGRGIPFQPRLRRLDTLVNLLI